MVLPRLGRFRCYFLVLCAVAAFSTDTTTAASSASSSSSPSTSDAAAAVAGGDTVSWLDCGSITNNVMNVVVPTECTTFSAPLCHAGICRDAQNRKVDVHIRRITTSSPSSSDAASSPSVWFLQGGPGTNSAGLIEAMSTLYTKLEGNVNVYTMDQRGTGLSTRFECLNATTSESLFDGHSSDQVGACAQQLQQQFGSDLSAFSVTSAARDVSSFVSKYHGDAKTFVYGVGYGSVLAERLIHLNTSSIAGYVLDAIRTTSGADEKDFMYMSNAATDFGEVADRLIDTCAGSVNCSGKFASVSLRDMLEKMYADFDTNIQSKCTALFVPKTLTSSREAGERLRIVLAVMLVDELAKGLIPAFVYRMNRCSDDDYNVIREFILEGLSSFIEPRFSEADYTSSLLYQLITFSEMWETPTPSVEVMRNRYEKSIISITSNTEMVPVYCALTKENSTACATKNVTAYDSPAIAYKRDQYWNAAAAIPAQASVLLISSQPDARTPQKYAECLYKALNGTNKAFFNPSYVAHGSLWWSPLNKNHIEATTPGMNTLVAYVQNSGDLSKLSTAYGVGGIPLYVVTASEQVSEQLFFTRDAFEGKIPRSTSSVILEVLKWVLVTLGLVSVAAAAYYQHRKKTARSQPEELLDVATAKTEANASSPSTVTSYDLESRV